jgi:hypothetical protein
MVDCLVSWSARCDRVGIRGSSYDKQNRNNLIDQNNNKVAMDVEDLLEVQSLYEEKKSNKKDWMCSSS